MMLPRVKARISNAARPQLWNTELLLYTKWINLPTKSINLPTKWINLPCLAAEELERFHSSPCHLIYTEQNLLVFLPNEKPELEHHVMWYFILHVCHHVEEEKRRKKKREKANTEAYVTFVRVLRPCLRSRICINDTQWYSTVCISFHWNDPKCLKSHILHFNAYSHFPLSTHTALFHAC